MSATAPRVMSRDEAKERLIALNQVIAMAVAAIKTERDILDRFFAESDTIDTIGPIFDPTLWNNTERRVTDALLRPVYEAARKLIVTYDRQCEATRAALAKRGGSMAEQPEWLSPPHDTPEYMMPAWLGALHHALGDDGIVAAFRGDTGNKWTPGKYPIERMIDKATGSEERFLREFVGWFNAHVWGSIGNPDGNGDPP